MEKPTLVIMAGGMGSRYGGLKQIDPVGPNGEMIIDYSIFDAKRAGFKRVVFLINKRIQKDFDAAIGSRIAEQIETEYAFQEIDSLLPSGYGIPEGREKPWGTAQAVLCCREVIDGPFAIINADDFYGYDGYALMHKFLQQSNNADLAFSMVAYQLENTLTDFGSVARGVCQTEGDSLTAIIERTHIEKKPGGAAYSLDGGETFTDLPQGSVVSMNFWGLTTGIFDELETRFAKFLRDAVPENPMKAEMYIPNVIGELLAEKKASVKVMPSGDKWYGVTYREDKPMVEQSILRLIEQGRYPSDLWNG